MRRRILMLTMLVALVVLPGLATAIPTDYSVNSGGSLSIQWNGPAALTRVGQTIALGAGSFTYDSDTGEISKLRVATSMGYDVMYERSMSSRGWSESVSMNGASPTVPMQLVVGPHFLKFVYTFTATPVGAIVPTTRPDPGTVSPVPEPTAALLFASGVGVVSFVGSRRRES